MSATATAQDVIEGRAAYALHCGDCLAWLPTLPAGCVDALVADVPYGINYAHGGGGLGRHRRRNSRQPVTGDAAPFDPSPLLTFPRVLLWGADHFRSRLPEGGTFLAWDKSCASGPDDDFTDAEFGWTNLRVKRNVCHILWKGIVCIKAGENRGRRLHPTQKPVALMQWCLRLLALPPDSVVCDPYAGSGTTGVAALSLGFRFLGCEIDPAHYVTASRRMADANCESGLFAPRPEPTLFPATEDAEATP